MRRSIHVGLLAILAASALAFQTVYITNSGDKYHRDGCRYLKKSRIAIDLSEARQRGKTACKVCKP